MDMSFENPAALAFDDSAFGLRPLTWHGLCAQIVAMQDLRRALAKQPLQGEAGSRGSFDARTASLIATGFSGNSAQRAIHESPVNPTSSANGKPLLSKSVDVTTGVWTGHAEVRD